MIEEVEREVEKNKLSVLEATCKSVEKIKKVADIKKRIIGVLREEPEYIFGTTFIFIKSKNHLLAHDISKELEIELKRSAEDTFHFRGEYNGIDICLYGAEEVLGCKIIPKKVMKEVTEYEVVCPEVTEK
jgi:hypothetical protein